MSGVCVIVTDTNALISESRRRADRRRLRVLASGDVSLEEGRVPLVSSSVGLSSMESRITLS